MSLVIVMCCQVEGSASGRSLVQSSLTECDISLSVIRRNTNPLLFFSFFCQSRTMHLDIIKYFTPTDAQDFKRSIKIYINP